MLCGIGLPFDLLVRGDALGFAREKGGSGERE